MSYIKLHRELLDSYSFANPNHLKVWIWLLLKANYKKAFVPVNIGKGIMTVEVKRGQLIFGRFKAEEELNMDGNFIYRTLKKFEELGQILINSDTHYSLITICKYESYQSEKNESEQPMNSQWATNEQHVNNTRTTREQHVNTYKEELEEKEEIEEIEVLNINKQNFQKFHFSDVHELPDVYVQKSIEFYHQTTGNFITYDEAVKSWDIFKVQNVNANKHYKSVEDIYTHFMNWIKNQKFNNAESKQISSVSQRNLDALVEYSKRFSGNSPGQEQDLGL